MSDKTDYKPKVSVIVITYNHEKFIEQSLKNILSQKVNFNYEVIVADDCSTDATQSILRKYAKQYPDTVKIMLRQANIGAAANFKEAIMSAKGEYIALCEGDDYWTDNNKMQLQADFLDSHSSYAIIFHPVIVIFEDNSQPSSVYPAKPYGKNKFTIDALIQKNFIQTNSVMYRRQNYSGLPTDILPLDWYLHLYHAQFGKIGFINAPMSVYRRHKNGIWWRNKKNVTSFWKKNISNQLNTYGEVENLFLDKPGKKKILQIAKMKLIYHILSEVEVKDQSEIINTIAEYSHAILQDYTNYLQLRATENVHHISEVQRHNSRLKSEKSDLIHLKNRISDDLSAANNKIAEIESTKAFRINRKLRNIKYAALTPKRVFSNRRHDHTTFHERAGKQIFDRTSSGAVILHLYYQDMWQYFSPQLNFLINTQKLDLFISMIENDTTTETKNEILKDYPKAHIFIMPNRGRDVLPFITISKILLNSGYEYFLKIHSKKSPQRHDGNTWANEIFTNLMIQEETDFHKLKRILTNSHTGLAGPANCYVPLPTYYNDNHHEIIRLISKIKDKKVASRIDKEKWDYGFFAGTMFWGRLDAIEPVINTKIRIMDFVEEGAQLDGTVAHALERVFCVIPELNKKSMYEITKGKVKKINYKTDYTPEWSDHYKEDK